MRRHVPLPQSIRSPVALPWLAVLLFGWLALPAGVSAAADGVPPPPSVASLFDWSFDPTLQLPLLLTAGLFLYAVWRVNRAHPSNPVPKRRVAAFLAGLIAIEVALQSAVGEYDDVLFSVHMVQHMLLIMVAAPLLVLGAPVTLLLRVARPDQRQRWILPILHSRIVRAVSFPVVAWILFAGAMWGTHFSAIFEISLENRLVHDLEHVLYLVTAILFWWPAIGVDPSLWRMPYPVRLLYVFLQMPQNSFLGLAIFSAGAPLYPHYASLQLGWGPTALADQQVAGGLMWVTGDLFFLVEILLLVVAWMRDEERQTTREDARSDAAVAAIRTREALLARRLADERVEAQVVFEAEVQRAFEADAEGAFDEEAVAQAAGTSGRGAARYSR